jgi:monoamine oxidase
MARTPVMSRLVNTLRRASGQGATPKVSRRDLIRVAVAASLAPAWGPCRPEIFGGKTVVIGAGIAGLHCAWRLVEANLDVVVYEAQNRVGGRLLTARNQLGNGMHAELGGEFIDTNHVTMWELANEFNIALDDRVAAEPPGMTRDTWWVNGAQVPEQTIVDQFSQVAPAIAAAFDAAETSDEDYELLDNTTMADFLLDVCPPSQFPELHAVLTSAYRGEYGLETDQQSCLNLVYLIDSFTPDPFRIFGESDERYHAHGGNDVFTTELANAVGSAAIQLDIRLIAVRDCVFGGYEVELERLDGTRFVDLCDHVVFAIPFTKLREVDLDVRDLDEDKQAVIDELSYGTNAKVVGGFTRRPWWDDFNASGSSTTDLPMQQTWDSSIGQSGVGGVLSNYLGGAQGVAVGGVQPTDWMANVALPDVETIWPGTTAAWDGTAITHHWPSFQWSLGSYTCYTPGQWAFYGEEGRRVGGLHFCGEHCSLDFQGWTEGAAETGALVAGEILDDHHRGYSARHQQIMAVKTLAPQASYHGDRLPRLKPLGRRRAMTQRVRKLVMP